MFVHLRKGETAWQTLDWLDIRSGEGLLMAGAAGVVGGLAEHTDFWGTIRSDAGSDLND
ncbi:hypothetical protein [Nonomuraea sp. CA-141351]|uniref:hypothetical protein n=1 Tax=Nonomuraea sp. CA-141351 TaxID=3239996 RepID=UPI003D8BD17D